MCCAPTQDMLRDYNMAVRGVQKRAQTMTGVLRPGQRYRPLPEHGPMPAKCRSACPLNPFHTVRSGSASHEAPLSRAASASDCPLQGLRLGTTPDIVSGARQAGDGYYGQSYLGQKGECHPERSVDIAPSLCYSGFIRGRNVRLHKGEGNVPEAANQG